MQNSNSSSVYSSPSFYDKFNPPEDVVHCPRGRASVRDALDEYAIAAVELYGLISLQELVTIYNNYCDTAEDCTDVDELYILLLPRVLQKHDYFFYDGYLCHPILGFNKDFIPYILSEQAGKPRFIPSKKDFLLYINPIKNLSKKWIEVFDFILDHIPQDEISRLTGQGASHDLFDDFTDMLIHSRMLFSFDLIADFLENNNIIFTDKKTLEDFFSLVMQAHNESGCWEHKGHSPKDLPTRDKKLTNSKANFSAPSEEEPSDITLHQTIQVGCNDPCICGSGKKYKQCCLKIQESRKAQLSPEDQQVFFKLWFGLLGFVGRKLKISALDQIDNWQGDDVICYTLRQALWNQPEIITDYLQSSNFNSEEKEILASWRDRHLKSEFFVVEHGLNGSFFTRGLEEDSTSYPFYIVKGLRNSIPWGLQQHLPVFVEAVLLPFRKQIVFDGYLQSYDFHINPNISQQLKDGLKYSELTNIFTSLD